MANNNNKSSKGWPNKYMNVASEKRSCVNFYSFQGSLLHTRFYINFSGKYSKWVESFTNGTSAEKLFWQELKSFINIASKDYIECIYRMSERI